MTKLSTFPQMATAQFSTIYYQEAIFTPPSEESNPTLSCTAYLRENARARIVTSLVKPDWRHFLGKNDAIGSIWSRCALFGRHARLSRSHVDFDFQYRTKDIANVWNVSQRKAKVLSNLVSIPGGIFPEKSTVLWSIVVRTEKKSSASTSLRFSCEHFKNTILLVSV